MIFYGFKMTTTNMNTIEKTVNEMKDKMYLQARKNYYELLSREIQTAIDEIAMGTYERPQVPIIDAASELLNKKIAIAIKNSFNTEYNLNAGANIFLYNKNTYIELATYNSELFKCCKGIKNLIDFSVNDLCDDDEFKTRTSEWKKVFEKYKDHSTFMIKLSPLKSFGKPSFEDLYFEEPSQRAEVQARHRAANSFLSMYAGGGEIQNYKLMEYMDQAFLKLTDSDGKATIESFEKQLLPILPIITSELVFGDPKADAEKQISSENPQEVSED